MSATDAIITALSEASTVITATYASVNLSLVLLIVLQLLIHLW